MAEVRSYRELEVWRRGIDLVQTIYLISRGFPSEERFGLTAQLRRAAVSVPSNIAEGHARTSTRDYLRFLSIALGSIAELETQIVISHRLQLLKQDDFDRLASECDQIGRMLRTLMRSLKRKLTATSTGTKSAPSP